MVSEVGWGSVEWCQKWHGIVSNVVREKLLDKETLTLETVFVRSHIYLNVCHS